MWHTNIYVLPVLTGETVDNFVRKQSLAQETSARGYKFHVEDYIHDFEGKLMGDNKPSPLYSMQFLQVLVCLYYSFIRTTAI